MSAPARFCIGLLDGALIVISCAVTIALVATIGALLISFIAGTSPADGLRLLWLESELLSPGVGRFFLTVLTLGALWRAVQFVRRPELTDGAWK